MYKLEIKIASNAYACIYDWFFSHALASQTSQAFNLLARMLLM